MLDSQRAYFRMNKDWWISTDGNIAVKGIIQICKQFDTNIWVTFNTLPSKFEKEAKETCQILNNLANG